MTNEEWAEWKVAEGRIHALSDWYFRLTTAQGFVVRERLLDLEDALRNIAETCVLDPGTAQFARRILDHKHDVSTAPGLTASCLACGLPHLGTAQEGPFCECDDADACPRSGGVP